MSNQVTLPKGGPVILPPAGSYALFVDTDGATKAVDSAGAVTALGGSVSVGSGLTGNGSAATPLDLSAANKAYIGGWFNQQQAWLTSKLATFTEFGYWKAGLVGNGAAGNGVEANLEGAAVGAVGGGAAATVLSTSTVWQAPKTSGFGLVCRGKFAAVSANVQMVGLINPAVSIWAAIALTTALDATKLVLRLNDGVETDLAMTVADTNIHDYAIIFDPVAAQVTCYQDQVLIGTQATITHLANVAMMPAIFNVVAGNMKATKAIWGYVAL
jgi:hypothetical protein